MSIKRNWRNGLGLGQIMAMLLVVLPTIAFSVTFLLAYWNVMQIDNRLKIIANLASDFVNYRDDLRTFDDNATTEFISRASSLCPGGQTIEFTSINDSAAKGEISITVVYVTPATDRYLADKTLSTNMQTYSYKDQNMSAVLTCPTLQKGK